VLLHGLGASSEWFDANVDVLAESHAVAAVDLIGFGRNRSLLRRTPFPLVFEEIAALLARWIESAFDEPVHLAGNSMGGHIAIHLAAGRPDLVRSLTLIDSTGIPFALDPRIHFENTALPRRGFAFARMFTRDFFRAGPTSLAIAFARLLRDDARPLMRTLKMPVLLVWGEHDPLVPVTYGQQMAEEMPHAKLIVIKGAGHVPMWENPTELNGALLAFVNDVDAAQRPLGDRGAFTWGLAGWTDGVAHREAGRSRDVVLLHGLGMSSRYFAPFARVLFDDGWSPVAPDLPGFGESANAPPMTPAEEAEVLARWAEALGIRDAVWIGHSTGCTSVARLASTRPDLVRRAVAIGPLWTRSRHPYLRFGAALALDGLREPLALWRDIVRAYWRCGVARWLGTWRRQIADVVIGENSALFTRTSNLEPKASGSRFELRGKSAEFDMLMIAGDRDALVDRDVTHPVIVPGPHACQFTNPSETAGQIRSSLLNSAPVPAGGGGSRVDPAET
jgi:pimeloyl-ACP methyl ester carboxylesterase